MAASTYTDTRTDTTTNLEGTTVNNPIDTLLEKHNITVTIRPKQRGSKTWQEREKIFRRGNHYRVTFKHGHGSFGVDFSTGSGWTEPPTASDVLETLASDAYLLEDHRSLDEFADAFGEPPGDVYDTWRATVDQTNGFVGWLNAIGLTVDDIDEALNTEHLDVKVVKL